MAFGKMGARGGFGMGVPGHHAAAAASLPLDGIAIGIKAAYSTRQLLTAYAGKAMNVKRASDSTTQDIGFVSNVLDTVSLATFCSGTTGSVNIWYDQSGGGFNMTPTGAAPIIYQSGAVTLLNGQPAPLFVSASSQFLQNASLSANPVNTLYQNAVLSMNTLAANNAIAGPAGVQAFYWRIIPAGNLDLEHAGIIQLGQSTGVVTALTGAVVEAQYNGTSGAMSFWINRAASGTATMAQTFTASNLQLGSFSNSNEKLNGFMGEYIAYDLVGGIPGASQTAITLNQKTYWGTP